MTNTTYTGPPISPLTVTPTGEHRCELGGGHWLRIGRIGCSWMAWYERPQGETLLCLGTLQQCRISLYWRYRRAAALSLMVTSAGRLPA